MMTDELTLMLNKFEAGTGKHPTKIICGDAAFEKLCREANDTWGADRYIEPNPRDGYVAKFMGIPIQVIHNQNHLEDDKIYVLSEPEETHRPIGDGYWWARKPDNNLIIDDLIDDFRDFRVKRNDAFAAHYYGRWAYDNVVAKHEVEEVEIDDNALRSVLNGGGFRAVA